MMKNNFNFRNFTIVVIMCAFAFALLNSCKREQYTTSTTEDVNITGYLEKYPDQFSLFTEMINRSGTKGYLAAYGKYTIFAPSNTAVTAWLKTKGKTQVADVSVEDLTSVVKFHLLGDTVATNAFTDGKLKQITFYGQYLQTGLVNEAGTSNYVINKLAKITKSNVRLGNGILHAIDHVLIPVVQTSAVAIETNPRYTMFAQALKETGFYDSLNVASAAQIDTLKRFQTVVVESDSALKVAGFANYAALKARLSKTGDPKNHADSLWLYVAYHISPGASYSPDIISSPALYTLAPKEIVTTKLTGQKLLLNEDEFAGVLEPGIEINRSYSDATTANGVIHEVKNFLNIKVRFQAPVYWDVADQPELRANPKWRGAAAAKIPLYANGASVLSGMIFNNLSKLNQGMNYDYSPVVPATRQKNYNDMFNMSMGSNTSRAQWVELRTPMLVKGKYKVWVCYSQGGSSVATQVGVDIGRPGEQILPNIVDFRQYLSSSGVGSATANLPSADALMLTNGFKRYMSTTAEYAGTLRGSVNVNTTGWDQCVGRLAGTVDIQTTDRHWIRFTNLTNSGSSDYTWLDMIHFIPVDMDQNYPRFSPSGVEFKRP